MSNLNQVTRVRIPQKINWCDLDAVIALAESFGPGHLVVKHADRDNYNITHEERTDLWFKPGVQVLHSTTESQDWPF